MIKQTRTVPDEVAMYAAIILASAYYFISGIQG